MQRVTSERWRERLNYIHLFQPANPKLPALELNKQKIWAAVSDCVDCHWEGFIEGRERWQSIAVPQRKERLDRLDGDFAWSPTKKQKEQLSLTHTLHTNTRAGTQTKGMYMDTFMQSARTCTQTKPVYCCLRAHFYRERKNRMGTGEAHEAKALISPPHTSCTVWQVEKTSHASLKLCMLFI